MGVILPLPNACRTLSSGNRSRWPTQNDGDDARGNVFSGESTSGNQTTIYDGRYDPAPTWQNPK